MRENSAKYEEIDLVVVQQDDKLDKPRKRGPPVRLTKRKFVSVCRLIESGLTATRACTAENISYAIWRLRIQHSPRLEARYKKAESIREQVWRADALEAVHAAFKHQWPSAMTFLERVYPGEFSLKVINRPEPVDAVSTATTIRVLTVPDADFLELQKEDCYTALPDGGLQMQDGNMRITVYSMSHNERLLK